jgi:hypothetical protein
MAVLMVLETSGVGVMVPAPALAADTPELKMVLWGFLWVAP